MLDLQKLFTETLQGKKLLKQGLAPPAAVLLVQSELSGSDAGIPDLQ